MYICKYCGRECKNKNSLAQHEIRCKSNPDRIISHGNNGATKGYIPWNKGLTKDTNDSVKKQGDTFKNNYLAGKYKLYNPMLDKDNGDIYKSKISKKLKDLYDINPWPTHGRTKSGWYKGIWCDSTWELAWVIYSIDNGVNFIRNNRGFDYIWEGSVRKYHPDFYLPDTDTYVEIKGYYDDKAKEKTKQFNGKLLLLRFEELEPILYYVYNKYGDDIAQLYDKPSVV